MAAAPSHWAYHKVSGSPNSVERRPLHTTCATSTGARPRRGEAPNEIGNAGARPRPLPVSGEAVLVDIHDEHGARTRRAGVKHLKGIECPQAQDLDRRRIPNAQDQKCTEHGERQHPVEADPEPAAAQP